MALSALANTILPLVGNRGGVASSRTKPPQAVPTRARHQVATESLSRRHRPHSKTAQRGLQAVQASDSGQDGGALTVEDLQQLAEQDMQLLQAELGSTWRAQFDDDIEGLYAFADRGHIEYAMRVQDLKNTPKDLWDRTGATLPLKQVPAGMAIDMMGMGTWRLRGLVDPAIEFMIGRIEGSLRELLPDDLCLYPPDRWKAKGWDFIDSVDPKREWDGWAYADIPDPDKGEEGYPRLQVENRIYCSRVFRKLHLEAAWRQDGLNVMHLVFFPRYDMDIPILAMDIVTVNGNVTLAIADACPVSDDLSLPQHYMQTMQELQDHFLSAPAEESDGSSSSSSKSSDRTIPDWGAEIFSPKCVCIRPQSVEEVARFIKYAIALTRAHLLYAPLLAPVKPTSKAGVRKLEELTRSHKRFCERQLSNKKTSRVLEVALGVEMATAYMNEIMFDFNPQDQPPWFDASISRMYDHFEERPEVWPDAQRFLRAKAELDGAKAYDALRMFLQGRLRGFADKGQGPGGPKLEQALEWMWDHDQEFRSAAVQMAPGLEEAEEKGVVGAVLAELLAEVMGMVAGSSDADAPAEPAKDEAPAAAGTAQ